ncbi:hypothetical protein [Cerasicoccus fimbriatus]|uniref:hypothetical protein n=1 Tax=Cerasicoccus fimbriatus TaxID=3014554 RepID=UPI0022B32BAE|nr:hypothetical protein [Cerasicoccus sp. TK19100]
MEERVKPFGLWRYGKEFLDAGEEIKDPRKPENPLDHYAPTPAFYLVSHSIELFLKSYLRGKKKNLKELRNVGHNLVEALTLCEELGLNELIEVNEETKAEIELLNQTYASKDFEYFKQGYYELPYYERVCFFAENLRDATKDFVLSTT